LTCLLDRTVPECHSQNPDGLSKEIMPNEKGLVQEMHSHIGCASVPQRMTGKSLRWGVVISPSCHASVQRVDFEYQGCTMGRNGEARQIQASRVEGKGGIGQGGVGGGGHGLVQCLSVDHLRALGTPSPWDSHHSEGNDQAHCKRTARWKQSC